MDGSRSSRFQGRVSNRSIGVGHTNRFASLPDICQECPHLFFPAKAHQIIAWRFRAASPNYENLATERSKAVWIVNYADGLTQLNGVPKAPIVVETHDIKFIQVAKKHSAPPFSFRSLLRMRSELGVLNCTAAIIAISSIEAGLFRVTMADPRGVTFRNMHRPRQSAWIGQKPDTFTILSSWDPICSRIRAVY